MKPVERPEVNQPGDANRLHPATLTMGVLNAITGAVIPVAVTAVLGIWAISGLILFAAFVSAAVATVVNVIRYRTLTYQLTEDELLIQEGVLEKTQRVIPFRRIQNIRLEQGPVHRLLSVANVQIETAGTSGAEATLNVIGIKGARQLQRSVQGVTSGDTGPHESAPDESPPGELVRKVSLRELVTAGLTSQVTTFLVGLAGILPLIFPEFDFIPGPFPDPFEKLDELPEAVGWNPDGIVGFALKETIVKSLLLVTGGLLASVAGYVMLWHGFKLFRSGDTLTWQYGLFTHRTGGLPRRRVQVVKIEEPLLRRLAGLATVKADTGGDQMEAQQQDKTGRGVLLPVVASAMLPGVIAQTMDNRRELEWQRISPLAVRRGTLKASLIVLLLAIPGFFTPFRWQFLAWSAALIPLIYFLNVMGVPTYGLLDRCPHVYLSAGLAEPFDAPDGTQACAVRRDSPIAFRSQTRSRECLHRHGRPDAHRWNPAGASPAARRCTHAHRKPPEPKARTTA